MNLELPDMAGLTAVRHIRRGLAGEAVSGIPIIAMAANDLDETRRQCLAAGFNDVIPTPQVLDQLDRILERILGFPHRAQAGAGPPVLRQ